MGFIKRLTEFLAWTFSFEYQGTFIEHPIDELGVGHPATNLEPFFSTNVLEDDSCVNSPYTRACWKDGFNITTDYEEFTPEGQLREYYLVISNGQLDPDGYMVDGMLVNNTYPGPLIEADWGDTLRVTVKNNLTNHNGTSIHWHGIRQLNTVWQDGVAGVTQCPIPPGEEFTYEFKALQYGSSWYHSHFSLQYPDGIVGPLKINGPTSLNYDVDLGPVLITDWLHKDAFGLYDLELLGRPPTPDSYLMNGKGPYYCCPSLDKQCSGDLKRTDFTFEEGKTYKMSIVNTAVSTHFTFWIDGHNFSVVATDFVPIEPYNTDTINVAIGQRYDIIIKANGRQKDQQDFWIHARDCSNTNVRSTLGILRYQVDGKVNDYVPWTPPPARLCYGCLDEPNPKQEGGPSLKPIVKRQVKRPANRFTKADSLEVALEGYPNPADEKSDMHKWILANSSLYLDWTQPSLSLISIAGDKFKNHNPFPKSYAPIILDYDMGDWVYFLIEGSFTPADAMRYKKQAPVSHPIHVHGHDFVILAEANSTFDFATFKPNLDNPPRRDVAMLPVNGHLVIAFQINNPGAWLMHCHIAWHASSGLALQFIEKPMLIKPLMEKAGIYPKYFDTCAKWGAYYKVFNENLNAKQEDSGI